MSLQPVFGARGIGFLGEYVDADSSSACNITEAVKTIKEAFV